MKRTPTLTFERDQLLSQCKCLLSFCISPNLAIVSSTIFKMVACEDSGCLNAKNSSRVNWSGSLLAASDQAALSLMMASVRCKEIKYVFNISLFQIWKAFNTRSINYFSLPIMIFAEDALNQSKEEKLTFYFPWQSFMIVFMILNELLIISVLPEEVCMKLLPGYHPWVTTNIINLN